MRHSQHNSNRNAESQNGSGGDRAPDRDLQALFQCLIENSFDVIEVVDAEATTLYVSPSCRPVLGFEPEEMIGRSGFKHLFEDDVAIARSTFKIVVETDGAKRHLELRSYRKDGELRTFEVVLQRLPSQLFVDGVVVNYRDITERKRAEEAHRRAEERFYKAFHSCPSSITISFIKDGKFIEVNDGFERLSGYRRDEIVGKGSTELNLWKNPEKRAEIVKILQRDGRVRKFETEFVKKSGEVRICHLSADVIDLDGEPCMLAVTHDITDRRRAQAALRRQSEALKKEREELSKKNIALKQVLDHIESERASFRHEISADVENLLTPIIDKLRDNQGALAPKDIDLLEDGLRRIVEEDINDYQNNLAKLTSRELDVCELIKQGLSSKEIAERLSVSTQTVHKHRRAIRHKLQLTNKNINLGAYLRSR
ncbi:MAG: PAS domain S-box protein [Candidatus Latescibacterota bacterium]|nr:MAG: PAS domain S-box protein [Candidatus Latescibacterota bacterium]